MMRKLAITPFAALAFLIGCSGEPMPAPQPPAATDTPATHTAPPPEPSASAAAETPAPSASASAKADAPPPKPRGDSTPAVLKQDATEVTDTFGSRPAKIEIGSENNAATLHIPENALGQGTNITFKLDPKGKANGAPVGKIYHVIPVIPPSTTPTTVQSNAAPFDLKMPAGSKKDANLAIGKVEVDDKGHEKVKWTVIAPTKIDDATGLAYFEFNELGDFFLHITTKPPTEAKK